jgi:hypothetical protein
MNPLLPSLQAGTAPHPLALGLARAAELVQELAARGLPVPQCSGGEPPCFYWNSEIQGDPYLGALDFDDEFVEMRWYTFEPDAEGIPFDSPRRTERVSVVLNPQWIERVCAFVAEAFDDEAKQ